MSLSNIVFGAFTLTLILCTGCFTHDTELAKLKQKITELEEEVAKTDSEDNQLLGLAESELDPAENESIFAFGHAFKNPSLGLDQNYAAEYFLQIAIINRSRKEIEFDKVSFYFRPISGDSYFITLRTNDAKKMIPGGTENSDGINSYTMRSGEVILCNPRTGLKTSQLVKDAGEVPLQFGIVFLKEDRKLFEFTTAIPKLDSLPPIDPGAQPIIHDSGFQLKFIKKQPFFSPEGTQRVY
jgi:hypothetical protein